MQREEFLEVLEDRRKNLKLVSIKSVEVVPPVDHTERRRLRFNGEILTDHTSFDTLCSTLFHVPPSFMRRVPIDLSNTIVKRMFKETKVDETIQLIVSKNVAVSSKWVDTPYQPALPVFERVLKELPGKKEVKFRDRGTHFDVDVVSEEIELKPKLNDITRGGVRCQYSEFMFKSPSIAPYTERLACLNGMTFPEFHEVYAFDDLPSFLDNIGKAVHDATSIVEEKISDQLQKAAELKVNGEQAIRRIFKANRVPPKLLDRALAAHVVEGDGTAYGVLQAITRAANTEGITDRNRDRLQGLGGNELAIVSTAHCPECYSEL